ncbi:beta strand repeat-containing protein [Mycetocola saprophilus]|uniref:beta strand repeat-containing protein n=1 Tax=Mycetocola saprophilus TaxID=76636 RepID=UPI0005BB4663|nr:hypothetical protein [Mycetocola saprophilus]
MGADGTWTATVTGLKNGKNTVAVTQTFAGKTTGPVSVVIDIKAVAENFTAKLDSQNDDAKSAVISGTGEPGATITVSPTTGTKTVTVAANGTWKITVTGLKVGLNNVSVTQTVGTTVSAAKTVPVTIIETVVPLSAKLLNVNNPDRWANITVTATPGATITATSPNGTKATAVVPAFTATVKPDGTWTATVTGLKLGANTAQVTQTFAGKTTGPVAVDILIETVVGNFTAKVESWDDAAKTAVIGGTGEPGATITLSPISGDVTVKVSANGTWKTTVTGLVVGPNIVPVTQTIGNEVSAPKNVTVNILANLAPLTVEVGTVDNAGRWANLTGTGQPGAQIIATVAGGASFTTQVAANGTWSTRVLGLEVGTNSVSVTQSADGVTSNPVTVAIRITEEVDSFTANLVGQDDSKRTAVIAGTGVIGATITLNTPSGNQTVEVDAEGNWQYTVTGLSIGNNPILVSQTVNGKPAGQKVVTVNIAAVTVPLTADVKDINDAKRTATIFGTGKPGATITLSLFGKDVTTTVAANGTWSREIGGLVIGSQSVAVTQKVDGELVGSTFVLVGVGVTIKDLTAKLVNVNNRERWANIGGTGQPGAVIIATNLNGTQFTATVANNGRWTMRVLDLNVGPNTIAVHQSYLGNVSPTINLSAAIAIWIAKPTIRVISQDDLAKTAVVGGTGEPGGIITVTFEGRKYTATVQEDGTWTRELTNLKRGANAVSAIQVIYGNTSDPVATTITLKAMLEDFTAKAAAANDAARTVEVSGTGVPGATIHLRPGSANATTTVVDAAGNWKATVSNLIVGENIIPVHQELDGKMSAPKNLYVSVVSTNRPLTGTATLNNAARSAALAGTATPGSVISVVLSNGTKLSTTTTAAGNWNTSATNLPLGVTVFSVTQTVGTETLNDGITLQVEVKATVGKLTAKISSTTSATGTVNVTGTGTAGATVTVSGPAGDKTVVVPANGNWSLDYSGLPDEASTLVAIQRLEGAESNTVDLSAFIIPPVTSAKVDRIASMAGTVYFSGTGIPGYAVRVTLGDKTIGSIVGADGTWTRQFNDVPMGTNDFTIVQAKGTDISRATALPVELTIPTIPFTAKLWQYSNSTLQARYTGTATPGSVITVTTEDGTKNTTTVPMTATGAWNFWATSGYKSGKNTVTITETTADGVESAPIYSTVTFP